MTSIRRRVVIGDRTYTSTTKAGHALWQRHGTTGPCHQPPAVGAMLARIWELEHAADPDLHDQLEAARTAAARGRRAARRARDLQASVEELREQLDAAEHYTAGLEDRLSRARVDAAAYRLVLDDLLTAIASDLPTDETLRWIDQAAQAAAEMIDRIDRFSGKAVA